MIDIKIINFDSKIQYFFDNLLKINTIKNFNTNTITIINYDNIWCFGDINYNNELLYNKWCKYLKFINYNKSTFESYASIYSFLTDFFRYLELDNFS